MLQAQQLGNALRRPSACLQHAAHPNTLRHRRLALPASVHAPRHVVRATRVDQDTVDDGRDVLLIADVSKAVDGQLAATVQHNTAQGQAPAAPAQTPLRNRVLASIGQVSKGLLERDTEVGPGDALALTFL